MSMPETTARSPLDSPAVARPVFRPTPRRDPAGGGAWNWLAGRTGRKADRTFRVRLLVQGGFAVTCLVLGWQFARFVRGAAAGTYPLPHRPAGVEGFLPISGLMGLVDFFRQGTMNTVHPAAAALVAIGLALAVLLRKAFCSWICPVGFLSESLARLGRQIFGRNFRPWKFLDIPLRGLRYLLLGFFLWAIFGMSAASLRAFLDSPYNRLADVKMGLFFVEMSATGAAVLLGLAVASVLIHGFWCRYLCPYGALLGLFSWFSPTRIVRKPTSCIDCGLCDRACMARLPVSQKINILSPECVGCLDCVAVCPVEDALGVQVAHRKVSIRAWAAAVLLLFFAGYWSARAAGVWDNGIGDREYIERIQEDQRSPYGHPGR